MKAIKLITLGLLISAMGTTVAQTGRESGTQYGVGQDSIQCLRSLSLYSENFRNNNYEAAFNSWEAAFNNCPASTVNLYIDGRTMVRDKIENNEDPERFEELFQLLMQIHDQRIEFFGDHQRSPEPVIKGNKALDMLRYKRNDRSVTEEAYDLLKVAINELRTDAQPAFLITFMNVSVNMYNLGQITPQDIVQNYTMLAEIIDRKLKDQAYARQHNALEDIKDGVERMFANSGAASCSVIEEIYGPQLEDNKNDLAWLQRVSRLLARGLCEDSELLYHVSEYQHNIEPSASSAFGLARMNLQNDNVERAIEYFEQAVELTESDLQKSEYLHQLSMIYLSQDRYSAARREAQRAISVRPDWGEPYIIIGQAYAASADQVGESSFETKTVFWAAVDKFIKAKSVDPEVEDRANEYIDTYSAHFPASDEIFFEGFEIGETYTVGGWINERTTVRAN
ncbi:tetratricopeptide repeat protein [Marinilabiliaceae bacterium ANBcel2]|nr:tetratricopeptide repeat protein [Marinilabiliaceae bacterium ANBcel2]